MRKVNRSDTHPSANDWSLRQTGEKQANTVWAGRLRLEGVRLPLSPSGIQSTPAGVCSANSLRQCSSHGMELQLWHLRPQRGTQQTFLSPRGGWNKIHSLTFW